MKRKSTCKLAEGVKREGVIPTIYGHDAEQWPTLKHAPPFYAWPRIGAYQENQLPKPITSLTCPCCNQERDVASETPLLEIEQMMTQKKGQWQHEWSMYYATKGELRWACQSCINENRAFVAQPWVQNFCDFPPYFAFYDAWETCEDYGKPFVFAAKEQQFWYEELHFWVQSWPKQCSPCRFLRRERKREQKAQMEASSKKSR